MSTNARINSSHYCSWYAIRVTGRSTLLVTIEIRIHYVTRAFASNGSRVSSSVFVTKKETRCTRHATGTFYVDDALQRTGPASRPFAPLYKSRRSSPLPWRSCIPHESSQHKRGLLSYLWSGIDARTMTMTPRCRVFTGFFSFLVLKSPAWARCRSLWLITVCSHSFPRKWIRQWTFHSLSEARWPVCTCPQYVDRAKHV